MSVVAIGLSGLFGERQFRHYLSNSQKGVFLAVAAAEADRL
jgi:hypothetical protein